VYRDTVHCSRCRIPLPDDADRCPRCLRKSTVVDPAAVKRSPSEGPLFVGVRAAVLLAAYAVYGPLVVLILHSESALKERGLWLPACFVTMILAVLPLRMAFAAPETASTAREAAREYAVRMAWVLGGAAIMGVTQTVAVWIAGETATSILLGLFFMFATVAVGTQVARVVREEIPARQAIRTAAKQTGLGLLGVVLLGAVFALRSQRTNRPTIVLPPPNLKELLDPMNLEGVPVRVAWEADTSGAPALHLRADTPELERTIQKLTLEGLMKLEEVQHRPGASGTMILVLPSRFESPENERRRGEEERKLNETLTAVGRTTPEGKPIRVRIVFGR
jgi:hypothetical protein